MCPRIEDPQDLVKVASRAHRVNEHQLDLLVGADHEHGAYRGIIRRRATIGRGSRIRRQHVIEFCKFEFRVADPRWLSLTESERTKSSISEGIKAQMPRPDNSFHGPD